MGVLIIPANIKKNFWVCNKIFEKQLGNNIAIGYGNKRYVTNVNVAQAFGEYDLAIFGKDINRTLKFSAKFPIDVEVDGETGIYFTEPTIKETKIINDVETIIYNDPEYISGILTNVGIHYTFSATRQK